MKVNIFTSILILLIYSVLFSEENNNDLKIDSAETVSTDIISTDTAADALAVPSSQVAEAITSEGSATNNTILKVQSDPQKIIHEKESKKKKKRKRKEEPPQPQYQTNVLDSANKFMLKFGQVSTGLYRSPEGTGYDLGRLSDVNTWIRFIWRPNIQYQNLSIQFYFPFYYGFRRQAFLRENYYNAADWDGHELHKDILSKIVYVDYYYDNLFFRFGTLPLLYWGSGYILSGYLNTLYAPEKLLHGIKTDYLIPQHGISLSVFTCDILNPYASGARASWQPLYQLRQPMLRPWRTLEVGHSIVRISDIAGTKDALVFHGGDVSVPTRTKRGVLRSHLFGNAALANGIEYSDENHSSYTYGPGLSGGWQGKAALLKFETEVYANFNGFVPRYLDLFHYFPDERKKKYTYMRENKSLDTIGWYLANGIYLGKHSHLMNGFYQFYSVSPFAPVQNLFRTEFKISEDTFLLYYQRKDITIENFFPRFFSSDSILGARVNVRLPKIIQIVFDFFLTYNDTNERFDSNVALDFVLNPERQEKSALEKETAEQALERERSARNEDAEKKLEKEKKNNKL